jgi:cellulose biosynthesis protein BcsQ
MITAIALSTGLAQQGPKVLLIDTDSPANSSEKTRYTPSEQQLLSASTRDNPQRIALERVRDREHRTYSGAKGSAILN